MQRAHVHAAGGALPPSESSAVRSMGDGGALRCYLGDGSAVDTEDTGACSLSVSNQSGCGDAVMDVGESFAASLVGLSAAVGVARTTSPPCDIGRLAASGGLEGMR